MAKLFDRVGQATATTGTGTLTLGAVITDSTNGDLATFADMGAAAADVVNYLIVDGNNWEIGTGTLGGTGPGFTLTRTVAKSKIAGTVGTTALTLSGSARVFSVPQNINGNTWAGNINAGNNIVAGNYFQAGTGIYIGSWNILSGSNSGEINYQNGFLSTQLAFGVDANDVFAHRRGANPQTVRIYGTTDSSSGAAPVNYSRLTISHAGGTAGATIATEAGGTGTAGPLNLNAAKVVLNCAIETPTNVYGYIGFIGLGYNNPGELTISNNAVLNWGSVSLGGTDVALGRDAANILGQRNLANAQTFRIYGSTDSTTGAAPTNYSRLSIKHAGGTAGATIATEAGGTGTAGPLTLSALTCKLTPDAGTTVGYLSAFLANGVVNIGTLDMTASSTNISSFVTAGVSVASRWGAGNSYDTKIAFTQNTVDLNSGVNIRFTNSTGNIVGGTFDTGLTRNAAGIVEVNNGTAGTLRAIRAAAFEQGQGTLTDAASIAWDVRANQSGIVTLGATIGATRALANPTNAVAGTTYILVVKQDATGSRALTYGTQYKWPGGVAPVLSTAANATDVLTFIYDGTNMLGVAQKAFA